MIEAFGRKTLGTLRPTWGTFLTPIVVGLTLGLVFQFLFIGTLFATPMVVGVLGAIYLFLFGHYKRSLVFFMGGVVGTVIAFLIFLALHALGG